jgi:acetoacetyl-CoA synthetase
MSKRLTAPWIPSAWRVERAHVTRFARSLGFDDYERLWRYSVEDLTGFWGAIWEQFDVGASYDDVLASSAMPGARWFTGSMVNYAERMLRGKPGERVALQHASESRPLAAWTWGELYEQTARIRAGLLACGVTPGDRVAALLPNIPETVAAFLATASLGAIWSGAAPEFGAPAIIDRFAQIDPKVILAVDGYRYGGRDFDCAAKVRQLAAELPRTRVVRLGYLDGAGWQDGFLGAAAAIDFVAVPFDHPLWIVYSSGTTGLPKPIVHGHGGILVEYLKAMHLHLDAHADDRILWFTTTGWMMWNFLVGVLLTEASIVLYDGDPSGDVLWDLAAASGTTVFGTSAAFIGAQMKADARPARGRDLSAIHAVGSTGSPLAPEGYRWIYDQIGAQTWLFSTSGGTDVCTGLVGGVPTLPVYEGEIQARALGAAVEAWNETGTAVVGEVGELVVTRPMPSMPVSFWGDPDGSRLRESYFNTFPGIWRHGDWIEITSRGTAIVYGRSDATINRGGVRMGTSEIYRAVLAEPNVTDALVVDVPRDGQENWMPLFVVLAAGTALDEEMRGRIRRRIRERCSPRHVPDDVYAVAEVPRTLSGKLLEVPVKRMLLGTPAQEVVSRGSLANPGALDEFEALARVLGHSGGVNRGK